MNPVIYFTKFMKGLSAEQIAQKAKAIGFDGLDLAIRKGQAVNSDNVTTELPKAMKIFAGHGLSVPLATLEGNAVDPAKPEIEPIFAACGSAGVRLIKLGYWVWQKSDDYWARVEQIQAALAKFEQLGRKHNVCALVHTHCDEYFGSNASGAMALVRNFDPRYVGVYLDPAHLSVDGELLPMGIAIAKSHLRMVAVKSARYVSAGTESTAAKWRHDWCQLDQGLVHWPTAVKLFKEINYAGPFSIHGEYSVSEELDKVLELVKHDHAFFRKALKD